MAVPVLCLLFLTSLPRGTQVLCHIRSCGTLNCKGTHRAIISEYIQSSSTGVIVSSMGWSIKYSSLSTDLSLPFSITFSNLLSQLHLFPPLQVTCSMYEAKAPNPWLPSCRTGFPARLSSVHMDPCSHTRLSLLPRSHVSDWWEEEAAGWSYP